MIHLGIQNDGTGNADVGNYNVELVMPASPALMHLTSSETRRARIEGFPRKYGWAELVRRAIDALEAAR